MIGKIKWFNHERSFGFIAPETGGDDVFVHMNEVVRGGMTTLIEGQRVEFVLGKDRRGRPAAVHLRKVG